jgi:hypothetical protein
VLFPSDITYALQKSQISIVATVIRINSFGLSGVIQLKNKPNIQHDMCRTHNTQTNTNNVHKPWDLLQRTGGKDESNINYSATELISLLSFISVVFVRYNIREGIFGTVEIRIDEFYS